MLQTALDNQVKCANNDRISKTAKLHSNI